MTYVFMPGDQAHTSGALVKVLNVVLHATVSPCTRGGARSVAGYFQNPSAGGLAHYVVDPGETVQTCREDVVCRHAPPRNVDSLGVELCDPQTGPDARWGDADHVAMLQRAAVLVADICKRHQVPTVYVNAMDLLAGKHGITMHRDVSQAWHQSSHTDPGTAFPIDTFLAMVRGVSAQDVVPPKPLPPISKELDMTVVYADGRPLCLLTGGRLYAFESNAEKDAYVAAGLPIHKVSPEQFDLVDGVSKRLA